MIIVIPTPTGFLVGGVPLGKPWSTAEKEEEAVETNHEYPMRLAHAA